MTKMENEKVANERSWQTKVKELQGTVDDMSEELEYLRQQTGEGTVSREQQLMDRIDEDAAKMEQLQRQVAQAQRMQSTLVQTEENLRAETKKVEEAEAMNLDLVGEKDVALGELEAIRAENEAQQQQIRQLQLREKYEFHPHFPHKANARSKGTATTGGGSSEWFCRVYLPVTRDRWTVDLPTNFRGQPSGRRCRPDVSHSVDTITSG